MGGVRANPFSRERDDGSLRRIIPIDRIIDIINDNGQQFLREALKLLSGFLHILLKQNTALLSTVRVSVCHRRDISHFSHI